MASVNLIILDDERPTPPTKTGPIDTKDVIDVHDWIERRRFFPRVASIQDWPNPEYTKRCMRFLQDHKVITFKRVKQGGVQPVGMLCTDYPGLSTVYREIIGTARGLTRDEIAHHLGSTCEDLQPALDKLLDMNVVWLHESTQYYSSL